MTAPTPRRGVSIRVKSVMLAVGYLVALSVVYGAFTLYLYQRELDQTHDRLQQTARIVAAELDAYVATGGHRLETVSRLPGLAYGLQTIQDAKRDGFIPPWTTLHYLFFKTPPFTGGVLLLDRSGKVLWTEPPDLPSHGQTLSDLAPIAEIYRTGRSAISGVLAADQLVSGPHVLIGVPIQNDGGELQGILAGVIDLAATELTDILAAVSTAGGRFVDVVDQNGIVLADTDPTRRFQRVDASNADAEPPMLASLSLSHAPWRVRAGQSPTHAMAPIWQFQRALWGIGLALLLAAALVAAPVLNGFVRAIKQLTDAAETVARGDLSQPVAIGDRRDELATLGRSFEQMRVELERSRHALEQRLAEREELIRLLLRANEELHAAQARLIETERFAAIGELSASVAHGIRNPLAGIKAAAEFASLEISDGHPLRETITDIVTEADKLEARITNLLDFAKPFEPHPAPCRIADIVADAAASLQSQMTARGIALVVDADPALPPVELDYAQIEQVLLVLLSNAVDAMPAGGRITIAARVVEDGRVRIDVGDTGPGIPPDQLRRVFTLFFTTKARGTGLGLAVAKKIVERHRGTITVHSEPGNGTRFTIDLPLTATVP
jgi:signal transduction histidine kinase